MIRGINRWGNKNSRRLMFTGLVVLSVLGFSRVSSKAINNAGRWTAEKVSAITGLDSKNVKENMKFIRDCIYGFYSVSGEVIQHPWNTVQNMKNFIASGIERWQYSPPKSETIPADIRHPIIFAVYHVGRPGIFGDGTSPGHTSLWFDGETIDADGDNITHTSMFHVNKGVIGRHKPSWKTSPFYYDVSEKCDLYVIDASKLGFDTPEKRLKLKEDIIREQSDKRWDLNNRNCTYLINKVTKDALLRAPRPYHPGLKNFDLPFTMGASLDRKCKSGVAISITPEALSQYGQMLTQKHKKDRISNKDIVLESKIKDSPPLLLKNGEKSFDNRKFIPTLLLPKKTLKEKFKHNFMHSNELIKS